VYGGNGDIAVRAVSSEVVCGGIKCSERKMRITKK